jgi:hypothetical protein
MLGALLPYGMLAQGMTYEMFQKKLCSLSPFVFCVDIIFGYLWKEF